MTDQSILQQASELQKQERFRFSVAEYCHSAVAPTEIVWPAHKMLNQSGRYLVSFMLIHNDYAQRRHRGPRPTLTALQAMVGSSPRQTAALVAALRSAHLVSVETDPDDGRMKHLRAAPALVTEIGRSGRLFVAAMDSLAARHPGRAPALGHPDRLGALIYRSAAHVLRHGMLTDPFPRILPLTGRDCGYPLLTAIVGAHYAATVPGAPDPIPLSLRGLADRLRVSRAHVGNLLREADEAGWFRTGDRRLLHLDPSLLAEFELWAACQMIFYDHLAGEICAESGVEAAGLPERAGLACVPAVPEIPTGSAAP
jgi:hypothetical protein